MKLSVHAVAVMLALGGMLVAGCRTTPGPVVAPDQTADTNIVNLTRARLARFTTSEKRTRAHAHYAAAILHDLNDEPDAALEDFSRAALYDSGDELLVLEASRRLILAQRPADALDVLLLATETKPDASGLIYARLGLTYSQLGKLNEAVEANRVAVRKTPNLLAGHHNLFLNQLQAGRSAEALKVLDQAAQQPGVDAEFLGGVAELYVNYVLQFPGQREAVTGRILALLDRAVALNPGSRQLRLRLADDYAMFGSQEKAAVLYEDLARQFGDVPAVRDTIRAKLADIYLRANDLKRATTALEGIVRDNPASGQAYFFLGGIAFDEKRWAEAVDNLQKAILFAPALEQGYYNLASAQLALDRTDDALATLAQAREKFPKKFALEYLTGAAHVRQKDYLQATADFKAAELLAQAGETNRLTASFYFQFGAALERKGDYAEAAKYFNKCIELAPDFSEGLNYLGYMWAERGEKLEQARGLIERALKIEPENEAYLDSMGWVLFKLNQPRQALDFVLKAVALSPDGDETLYDHLGDIYAALHELDKAREFWEKSLSLKPDENIRKKLDGAGTQ